MKLFICTTAINRSELHTKSFENYNKILQSITNYEIEWHINIDKVKDIEEDRMITCENIKKIINSNKIKLFFNISDTSGMTQATKYLFNKINENIKENDLIFWLEDDWIIEDNTQNIINIILQQIDKNTFLSFFQYAFCSFAPCIFGYNVFKNIFLNGINMCDNTLDPEFAVQNYIGIFTRGAPEKYNVNRVLQNIIINCKLYEATDKFTYVKNDKEEIKLINKNTMSENGFYKYTNIDVIFNSDEKYDYIHMYPMKCYVSDIGIKWRNKKNLKKWDRYDCGDYKKK